MPKCLFFSDSWCKKTQLLVIQQDKPECKQGNHPELNYQCNNCSNDLLQPIRVWKHAKDYRAQRLWADSGNRNSSYHIGKWVKSFGTEECSSQNQRGVGQAWQSVNRHHLAVCALTHSALGSLTFSFDLKVRERVHEQQKQWDLISYKIMCFVPNLLLSTFSIKHPLGKAEVTHVLISRHSMNKTLGWLVATKHHLWFICLPLPQQGH